MNIKLVDKCLDSAVATVLVQKVKCEIFDSHGCNPLPSMHVSVDQNRGLLSLSCTSPDLDPGNRTAF